MRIIVPYGGVNTLPCAGSASWNHARNIAGCMNYYSPLGTIKSTLFFSWNICARRHYKSSLHREIIAIIVVSLIVNNDKYQKESATRFFKHVKSWCRENVSYRHAKHSKRHDTAFNQIAASCLSQLGEHIFFFFLFECQWVAWNGPKVILHTTDTKHVLAVSYRIRQAVVLPKKIGLWGICFNLMCQQVKIPCRKTRIRGQ